MNWLFPYRAHLEAEIVYLHEQLAREQRRRDELEVLLAEIAKPPAKVLFQQKPDGKLIPIQPRGWDAFRNAKRQQAPDKSFDHDPQPESKENQVDA